MKHILFIIAQKDFRDEELLETKEVLEQKGFVCSIASIEKEVANGMLGAVVIPDFAVQDVSPENFDGVVIVGGAGAPVLEQYEEVKDIVTQFFHAGKIVTAICIAPMLLAKYGILTGKKATVFLTEESLSVFKKYGVVLHKQDVVQDGNIITANGPKAARRFGETIAKMFEKQ